MQSVGASPLVTKEVFYNVIMPSGTATWAAHSFHSGILIDADDEGAYTECYVPLDFHSLTSLTIVFIARVTLTPMTLNVRAAYAKDGELAELHDSDYVEFSANTTINIIDELDISSLVTELEAGDHVAIVVRRVLTQNTNIDVLGVRLKYV